MTLDSLKHGTRYVIDDVDAAHPAVQRLMVLGLVEGAEIELASSAIGGDPIEFRLFRQRHFPAPRRSPAFRRLASEPRWLKPASRE